MIIQQVAHKHESKGLGQAAAFTFALNAKSFRQTMSGMYSRPIEAIMREYTANAYDATRDANARFGTPFRPPEIHLPTTLNPVWSCRDYGTGMSHQFMMTGFVQMYNSTKDRTNDFIGSFGIGSKSFFAYTDQATFTIWFEGMMRIYNCHLSADGLPMISVMFEGPSDEPSGVKVEFPVQNKDFNLFKDAAEKVFGRFDPMPKLTGWKVTPEQVKYITKGNGWGMRKHNGNYWDRDIACAIQGHIAYPLKSVEMDLRDGRERLIFDLPIDIEFSIGELEVTTSREDLMYTDFTKANIAKRLKQIAGELTVDLQKELDAVPTLYEATKFMGNRRGDLNGKLWDIFAREAKYKGKPVGTQIRFVSKDFVTPKHPLPSVTVCELGRREMELVVPKFKDSYDTYFTPQENTWIVWDDRKVLRWRAVLEHNKMREKHLILIRTEHRELLDKVIEAFGNPPFDILSELDPPPKEERDPSAPKRPRNVQKLFRVDSPLSAPNVVPTTADVAIGGFYVPTFNGEVKGFGSWSNMKDKLDLAKRLGVVIPDPIYTIPATHKHIPEKNPGWVKLYDWLREAVTKQLETLGWRQAVANWNEMSNFSSKWNNLLHQMRKLEHPALTDLVQKYDALNSPLIGEIRTAISWLNDSKIDAAKPGVKPTHDVMHIVEKLIAKYPMLTIVHHHVTYRVDDGQVKLIEAYLNDRDRLARKRK